MIPTLGTLSASNEKAPMKILSFTSILLSCLIILSSCKDAVTEPVCCLPEGISIEGTWLLFEQGYSPGGGYIINEVPAEPAQTITFGPGNKMTSTVAGWEQYVSFDIANGATIHSFVLKFHKLPSSQENATLESIVSFEGDGNEMRISNPMCIEGCHDGFKRIAAPSVE
jgi:hypothetical protein